MNLDTFIITCFCLIDEMVPVVINDHCLRACGPAPRLCDSEVITMEVVASYLGLSQDTQLFAYFQRHYTHLFPGRCGMHCTTFVRQAANLWVVKECVWCWLRDEAFRYALLLSIIDCVPVSVCRSLPERPGESTVAEKPATAKTILIAKPFTVFIYMFSSVGRGCSLACSRLRLMKPMERVRLWCWKVASEWSWETATIGCPICNRSCAAKAFCRTT